MGHFHRKHHYRRTGWKSKVLVLILFLVILGYLGGAIDMKGFSLDNIKEKVGNLGGNNTGEGYKKIIPITNNCKKEVNEEIRVSRAKTPETTIIKLIESETFTAKVPAIAYVNKWGVWEKEGAISKIENTDFDRIIIYLVKLEGPGAFDMYGTFINALICVNGTLI